MKSNFSRAVEVHDALEVSDGKTPVLLGECAYASFAPPVQVWAAKNKYKNGFAIFVHGKSGKYSVDGCQHYSAFNLNEAMLRVERYIEKWQIV